MILQTIRNLFNGGLQEPPLFIKTNKDDLITKRLLEVKQILGSNEYENSFVKVVFKDEPVISGTKPIAEFYTYYKSLRYGKDYPQKDCYLIFIKRYSLDPKQISSKMFNKWIRYCAAAENTKYILKTLSINGSAQKFFRLELI